MNAQAGWKVVFAVKECEDGGIIIDPTVTKPELKFSGEYNGLFDHTEDYIKRCFSTAGNNLEAVVGQVKNVLQGKERFFVPVSTGD
jgi:hypothetical protein